MEQPNAQPYRLPSWRPNSQAALLRSYRIAYIGQRTRSRTCAKMGAAAARRTHTPASTDRFRIQLAKRYEVRSDAHRIALRAHPALQMPGARLLGFQTATTPSVTRQHRACLFRQTKCLVQFTKRRQARVSRNHDSVRIRSRAGHQTGARHHSPRRLIRPETRTEPQPT